jgi:hypothetical protein
MSEKELQKHEAELKSHWDQVHPFIKTNLANIWLKKKRTYAC